VERRPGIPARNGIGWSGQCAQFKRREFVPRKAGPPSATRADKSARGNFVTSQSSFMSQENRNRSHHASLSAWRHRGLPEPRFPPAKAGLKRGYKTISPPGGRVTGYRTKCFLSPHIPFVSLVCFVVTRIERIEKGDSLKEYGNLWQRAPHSARPSSLVLAPAFSLPSLFCDLCPAVSGLRSLVLGPQTLFLLGAPCSLLPAARFLLVALSLP
jgi:hypothetical protein